MNENLRVSDADRERIAGRLREHFAEGRLTSEELDERLSATFSAKTVGELRAVMTDLPEPEPAGAAAGDPAGASWADPRGMYNPQDMYNLQDKYDPQGRYGPRGMTGYRRRGPRLLPLALLLLILFVALPGAGFAFAAVLKLLLVIWLVTCVVGLFARARFRRHVRRSRWRK